MKVLYGMPTSGKSTLLKAGLPGVDTDIVRELYGFRKHEDDKQIFLTAMKILAHRESRGQNVWLVTNLGVQVTNFSRFINFDLVCLPTPERSEMVKRLATRDSMSISEAENLLDSWSVRHTGEPVYPTNHSGTRVILKEGSTDQYLDALRQMFK